MQTPLYKQALAHGWRMIWRHVWLWPMGLFAAVLGQLGLVEVMSNVWYASSTYALHPSWLSLRQFFRFSAFDISLGSPDLMVWGAVLAVLLIALLAAIVFVAVVSQGALIDAAARAYHTAHAHDEARSWHVGVAHFWRLLGIQVVKWLFVLAVTVFVGWATLNMVQEATAFDGVLFLLVYILALSVGVIMSFLAVYAAGYVVVEEYPLIKAVRAAWRLFTQHWLVSIEVGVILLALNIVLGAIAAIGLMVLLVPAAVMSFLALFSTSATTVIFGASGFWVLALLWVMTLGAWFTIYVTSVWTYLFMHMHNRGVASWILRQMQRLRR